ncbi:proprotein convertase subtilisin/kexin type 4 isoform X2 [Lepisosteus oculatus]|uniref:proprotein convertase subtilisin/kexin type 4 isoform X2 n=1 Tax=Lepisosteus oculatus TaxID=7918 RepID=UPI00073FE159|nr:PREDICTED: proprotein convertase subtilisin/kexin type 4 isoform X2 [Lepisosteus oculatus]
MYPNFSNYLSIVLISTVCLAEGSYTSTWAVRVQGPPEDADKIARKYGFVNFGKVLWHEQQSGKVRQRRHAFHLPTDPLFSKQWYLSEAFQLNVVSAWAQGYTGKGVVVSILDDGIEKSHPDLAANYDPEASYDMNDDDPDPQPRYTTDNENRHGTRCAGEVAAVANNTVCGVGVAYRAQIGGVRMLDGHVTDLVEALSLSWKSQHIDIYSASWGPQDDGRSLDGPGVLAKEALIRGVIQGRRGLGSIFVWASGNGGAHFDNCNCDGYANSMYTVLVGSTTERGTVPEYSEPCSAILTTTYSSGSKLHRKIVTTDLRATCTAEHSGTSASAPLAAGIIALALEANPTLTWRDVQHVVIRASRPAGLRADDWQLNGVGRAVSHHYGYGLLDAGKLVNLARKWKTVRPQRKCFIDVVTRPMEIRGQLPFRWNVSACSGTGDWIRSLEHVQARLSLACSRRGDLAISLTSPRGTRSLLATARPRDTSPQGYSDWAFTTTHCWDEDPRGVWTLSLEDKGDGTNTGVLSHFRLELYGTEENVAERGVERTVVEECLDWSPQGICQECRYPLYAFDRVCLVFCPPHHYEWSLNGSGMGVAEARRCQPCHPSCYTCHGEGERSCASCPPLSTHNALLGTCSPVIYAWDQEHQGRAAGGVGWLDRLAATIGIVIGAPVMAFCVIWAFLGLLGRYFPLPGPTSVADDHLSTESSSSGEAAGVEMVNLGVPGEDEAGHRDSSTPTARPPIREQI